MRRCRLGVSSGIKHIIIGVAGLIAVVVHDMGDRRKPVGVPAVEFAVSAAASLQELMLVFETRGIRGDTAKEVGANKDGVVGRGSWCRVGEGNHAEE